MGDVHDGIADEMESEELAEFLRELEISAAEADAGQLIDGANVLAELRKVGELGDAGLHESIREGIEDMEAGRTVDAKKAIAELRSRL